MSTPEQPDPSRLTRRQLRELRNTAATPIITPEEATPAPLVAPLAREAEPAVVHEPAPAAEDVDLDKPALTRRAARQQERLRTASVPVITDSHETVEESGEIVAEPVADSGEIAELDIAEAQSEAPDIEISDADIEDAEMVVEHGSDVGEGESDAGDTEDEDAAEVAVGEVDEDARPVVAPGFGSGLLAGEGVDVELPPSFDQLLARGGTSTGSLGASNALILSQTPETGSFVSPVTATGEVLITGTFNLPANFGSTGAVPGSADGKETDSVLVDGELPASSSPTPIAASAAISTIKSAEDIIKPPAPEKGNRLMMALVITAGALALALTGVLIVALVTGAF